MYEKRVARAYNIELLVSLAVYAVLLVGSIRLGRPMADGWERTLVLLVPMIGFGLMIRALIRHVARVDEYQRVRLLENIALASAITAGLSFSYGFLETAGYPKLSMFSVWIALGASFGAVLALRAWRER
jgi:energy-converting hydrogenase Eha subunit A